MSQPKAFQSKQLFITYPQCPLAKEDAAAQLHQALDDKVIKELVIAQEHHKDGGLHLHAYIRLDKQYRCKGEHQKLFLKRISD